MQSLKLSFNGDIRRVPSDGAMRFSGLVDLVRKTFVPVKPFRMTYIDDDKETVLITSDLDLAEAVRVLEVSGQNILRVNVTCVDDVARVPKLGETLRQLGTLGGDRVSPYVFQAGGVKFGMGAIFYGCMLMFCFFGCRAISVIIAAVIVSACCHALCHRQRRADELFKCAACPVVLFYMLGHRSAGGLILVCGLTRVLFYVLHRPLATYLGHGQAAVNDAANEGAANADVQGTSQPQRAQGSARPGASVAQSNGAFVAPAVPRAAAAAAAATTGSSRMQDATTSAPQDPCAVSTPELKARFQAELKALGSMGFQDAASHLPLLQKHDGDMIRVIEELYK